MGQRDLSSKAVERPAATVEINQASVEELARLPGIGPALARRIVAFREKHGPFRRIEDLLAIRGIGPRKWKSLRPYLRLDPGSEKESEKPSQPRLSGASKSSIR